MLDEAAVGYRLVLTKADKIKASELAATLAKVEAQAKKHVAAYPVIHVTSAESRNSTRPENSRRAASIWSGSSLMAGPCLSRGGRDRRKFRAEVAETCRRERSGPCGEAARYDPMNDRQGRLRRRTPLRSLLPLRPLRETSFAFPAPPRGPCRRRPSGPRP